MKLPNRYGSVYKLSGKRRNPWAVRKSVGWEYYDKETGEIVTEPTIENIKAHRYKEKRLYQYIGFYKTKQEALQALAQYNADPFAIQSDITFAEVYDKWSKKKFESISESNRKGYSASFNTCSNIHTLQFHEIKLSHLQGIVDNCGKNYPTLKKLKILFSQLFDYAVMNNIISKECHIVEYVDIGKPTKSTKHYRFTDAEIDTMWRWSKNNDYVKLILMLIYTGVRPGELFALKKVFVNLEKKFFYVEKGKNDNAIRMVPIHDKVFPFFVNWMDKNDSEYLITQHNGNRIRFDTNHAQFVESYWSPVLSEMGILEYTNDKGETREHTPDDTRHTFTTRWKEKKLDEAMRRKIQGHSGKGIGEITYTHYEFEKLRKELNMF